MQHEPEFNPSSHATQAGKPARKLYLPESVLDAAVKRVRWTFDTFTEVSVSVSGGKDSTVLAHLAQQEAARRGRDLHMLFLDQEAEYAHSIRIVEGLMTLPHVVPHWYQVPVRMTNATSYGAQYLHAWDPAWEGEYVQPRHPLAIQATATATPDRFYPFLDWWEETRGAGAGLLIGLRSEESLNRYASVTRHPGVPGVPWTSRGLGGSTKIYPLYDWAFEDIWTYLGKYGVPYNRVYDWMWVKGFNISEMRVSNLIHERAFKSLATLQEFEPDTYRRLIERVPGARTAALYAKERQVYSAGKLPSAYRSWLEYREFLLDTLPLPGDQVQVFRDRFTAQASTEPTHRQQVRQLLLGDVENNIPVKAPAPDKTDPREKWRALL